ncbi:MAG: outer membrane lipoprotein-sorting protein, partial [Pseudomonadota bacterium]
MSLNLLTRNLFAAVAACAVISAPAMAQDDAASLSMEQSDERGYEIAARSDRSDTGFGSSEVSATMVLRNAAGQETTRELSFRTLERENESVGDKSLVIFETPRDVEGTALLSHA